MAREILNNGTLANDNTGDTLRAATTKINNNFREVYMILGDSSTPTTTITLGASSIISEGSNSDDYETTLTFANTTSSDKTITLPDLTGTVSLITATETLTNKTLTSPVLTTPQINDTSANHQYVVAVSELAADRTVTLPLLGAADEFVFKDHTVTMTNKTLTSPVLTTPKVAQINDTNGNEAITLPASSGSSKNFFTLKNADSGDALEIVANGANTADIDISLKGSGAGAVNFGTKMSMSLETLTSSGDANDRIPLTLLNNGGATAIDLVAGTKSGQMKKFINIGAGVSTITPANFANGTTVALAQYAVAELLWTGAVWVLCNQATVGTVPALTVA